MSFLIIEEYGPFDMHIEDHVAALGKYVLALVIKLDAIRGVS